MVFDYKHLVVVVAKKKPQHCAVFRSFRLEVPPLEPISDAKAEIRPS